MSTPFVSTVFVVLTTLNNAGQLSPVDKSELPAPYTGAMFWSEQQCMYVRGRMAHPEKYVCQIFRGPAETDWTYHPEGSFTGDPVAPSLPDTRGDATQLPADGKAVATASLSRNDDVELAGGRYHYSKPLFLWIDGELPPEKVTGLEPRIEATPPEVARPKVRTAQRRVRYAQQFDPIGAIVSLVTAPFARGDW
jgi:hypothetical protein